LLTVGDRPLSLPRFALAIVLARRLPRLAGLVALLLRAGLLTLVLPLLLAVIGIGVEPVLQIAERLIA